MSPLVLIGLTLNLSMALMCVVWLICRRLNNASFVEAAWSYGFALNALLFAGIASGAPWRRLLVAVMVSVWSFRLGTHLLLRICRLHPKESVRYARLRELFSNRVWMMFFGFFQFQAVLLGFLCTPFAIASSNPSPSPHILEVFGVFLWLIALVGHTLAGHQQARFYANAENREKACDVGFWRYSRHPDYFFEWLIWIAFFVFASGSPGGWVSVFCPLLMLYLLTKVTGIPPVEAESLKLRGEAYGRYQSTTSAFIPWPPKTP